MLTACQERALAPWITRARPGRALDIGCGVGRWSIALARCCMDVTGLDISQTMLAEASRRAQRHGVGCRFLLGDVTRLNVPGTFDLILVVTVLDRVSDRIRKRIT